VSTEQKPVEEAVLDVSGGGDEEPESLRALLGARLHASAAVQWLERYSLLVLLIVTIAFFGFFWDRTASTFMQTANFQNIIRSQTVLAVLALGVIVPLVCSQFDLSVGNVAGMTSVFTAAAFARWHVPLPVGIGIGVGLGALAGLVNGTVVTRLGVSSFIATLGSAAVIIGIVNWYTQGISIIQGIPPQLTDFGGGNWLGIPSPFYIVVLVALLVYYLLEHTPYGRNLHAVGSNVESARLVGLRIPRIVFLSFVVSGTAAGLGGVLLVADSGAGNPSVGSVFTLTALTAAFLGATSVKPGRFNVVGTLLAIFFLAAAITGLTFAGVRDYINDLFTGFALVLAVGISVLLGRRRAARGR
jgi:ribose transport system permease protein